MTRPALLGLALASLGCLDAEAPRICVSLPGQPILGTALPGIPSTTVTTRLEYPLDKVAAGTPKGSTVDLLSLELDAPAGHDFAFVQSIELYAIDVNTGAVGDLIARYQYPGGAPSSVLLQPASPWDVTSSLAAKKIAVQVSVTGTLPSQSFTADALACFSARYSGTP